MDCTFCKIDMSRFNNMDKYFHFLRHYKVKSFVKDLNREESSYFFKESCEKSPEKLASSSDYETEMHMKNIKKMLNLTHHYKIL